MAFPTTGLLDDFDGVDENPITTNWTTQIHAGHERLQRVSNYLTADGIGVAGSGWYDQQTFSSDCEAYITLQTLPDEDSNIRLCARLSAVGTTAPLGYYLILHRQAGVTDEVGIFTMDDIQIGTFVSQEFAAGDSLGFELIGTALKGYRKTAGVWSLVISETDGTYTGGGFLGVFYASGATLAELDDFGGGNVVAAPGSSFREDLLLMGVN